MDLLHPVLELQLGNSTEVPGVIRDQWNVILNCDAGDLQIQVIQNLATGFRFSF